MLMMVSLAGICAAEQSPSYIAHIQGGQSIITNESSGMTITVQDVISNVTITTGNMSNLTTVDRITNLTYPLSAAVVFSGNDSETTSLVTISNLSLSEEKKGLTFQATPLKYYDGEELKSFAEKNVDLASTNVSTSNSVGIYIEIIGVPLNNDGDDLSDCVNCFDVK